MGHRGHRDLSILARRLQAILDKVDQGLAELCRVGGPADLGNGPRDLESTLRDVARVEAFETAEQLAQLACREPGCREATEVGELLEQVLQPLDLFAHDADRLVEHLGEVGPPLIVAAPEIGHRDRDRRERVLDLVGHLAGHLPPGCLSLAHHQTSAIRLKIAAHGVERLAQSLEFSHAMERQRLLPIAARESAGERRQIFDRA